MVTDLKALRTFLLAADTRNFAQVARETGTTPASVSRTIAALEAELGIQLFIRTTRQVSLTTDGAVFAARVEPAVRALDAAKDEVINAHRSDEGRLRINAPLSFGQRVLPQILCDFRRLYPRIDVEVALTDELVDMVNGDFDLAIRISGPPTDKYTIWRKICEIGRIFVVAPGGPLAAVRHPGDLPADACFGYSSESRDETWQLTAGAGAVTLTAGRRLSANNGEFLAQMAQNGAGVAMLPRFIVADQLRDQQLVQILPDWHPPQLWLTLFYPPYQKLPPRIAAFSDFFEERVPLMVAAIE